MAQARSTSSINETNSSTSQVHSLNNLIVTSSSSSGVVDDNELHFDLPYDMYKRFLQIVLNETTAPELLVYAENIVDGIVEQINHMNTNLNRFRSKVEKFLTEQHELELERFRYILCKYHRTRIQKIERNASYLVRTLKEDIKTAEKLMSPPEIKYLDRYITSIEGHLNQTVLSHLPSNINSFKMADVPFNSRLEYDSSYVFVEALKDTTVSIDDTTMGQEVVDLKKGSKYFLPYSAVRSHFLSSSTDLILL